MLKEIKILNLNQLETNKGQIEGIKKNPRFCKDDKYLKLKKSLQDSPEFLELRELVVYPYNNKYIIIGGNMRYKALQELGIKQVTCKILNIDTPIDKINEFIIKDNVGFGEHDFELLANEWDISELKEWGLDINFETEEIKEEHGKLSDKFVIPPFSILDTRQGYWIDRKAFWKGLINDNGESREETLAPGEDNIMGKLIIEFQY